MKFTPAYNVSYKGEIYPGGVPFEIDEADAEVMSEHGTVEIIDKPPARSTETVLELVDETTEGEFQTVRRRAGRPKKTN